MTSNNWIGVISLFAGILVLVWTLKTWKSGDDLFTSNAKGILGGIFFIVIGAMLLAGQLHWK